MENKWEVGGGDATEEPFPKATKAGGGVHGKAVRSLELSVVVELEARGATGRLGSPSPGDR